MIKTSILCLSVLVLVISISAIALPLTDASDSDTAKAGDSGRQSSAAPAPVRKQAAGNAAAAKSKRVVPITAEMEAEVGKFVREHHAELVEVLAHLKANLPEEYERAVRDLNRNRLRLQQLAGRDRYAAELELWKAQSRARLLGARVQMGSDDRLRDALRETLVQIYDLRATLVQQDRDRAAERLKKLDEQLDLLQKDRDENLEKQLAELTKTTQKRTKPVTTSARNAKPAPSRKTPVKKSSTKNFE